MALLHDSQWWEAARNGQAWAEILALYNFDKPADGKEPAAFPSIHQVSQLAVRKLVRSTARILMHYINIDRAAREERALLCEEYRRALDFYCRTLEQLDAKLIDSTDIYILATNYKLMEVRWRWQRNKEELVVHEVA